MLYAKKFYYVLLEEYAQDLLTLDEEKLMNVMKSLAALSKYLGCYDRWQETRQRYQLKWTSGNSFEIFDNIVGEKENYPAMLDWLRNA
jgi:hypothetical protein